ncbi:HEAT repeat domain-containing protein [Pontiella sulfatireligans]|uniref:HEAT repeat domain-containing protein n=1 Tax=Pontiella sulfatireligans TaxID=2750658 RepID=A0A6C2URD7_9BACT|nr:hypothetical protein [Pontiella sulfatireligans]VGO22818.1 hypothetical protein SCARR_04915 [Pontiella sulfatireligans]
MREFIRLNTTRFLIPTAISLVAVLLCSCTNLSGGRQEALTIQQRAADAMASGNPALQTAVIEGALQRKDPKLYDVVVSNLDSLPPALQVQALGVIQFSGNRAYARAVEPLLMSEDAPRRDAAALTLACIGTADSATALLNSGTAEARKALGVLNAEGVDAILETAAAKKGDDARRAAAIDALAMRGRQDLVPQFFVFAAEDNLAVSTAAVGAIGLIGNVSNLEQLTSLMIAREASSSSRDILKAIVEIMRRSTEQARAVEILVVQMEGTSPRSQANILQALVQTGSKEALQPIVQGCNSPDEQLQKQAVKLLGGWQDVNGIPTMLELASDDSMSLANHVTLMRGVSRLYAGARLWLIKPADIQKAIDTCRRPEEKEALQATLDKIKK